MVDMMSNKHSDVFIFYPLFYLEGGVVMVTTTHRAVRGCQENYSKTTASLYPVLH